MGITILSIITTKFHRKTTTLLPQVQKEEISLKNQHIKVMGPLDQPKVTLETITTFCLNSMKSKTKVLISSKWVNNR